MATTRTPRQQIFLKLEQALERAKQSLNMEVTARDFEDLDSILFLARDTADVLRIYNIRRALLLQIYAALIEHPVDLDRLDTNWDGQGLMPTQEFARHLGTIAVAVADRIPHDKSSIENPFDGERTTCADLRAFFMRHCTLLGVPHAAQAFATA